MQKLKGIGPATASLILAVYDPENIPFFSDELFRWLHYEDAKTKGWDRVIKYTMKEYKDLIEKVAEVRERLDKLGGDRGKKGKEAVTVTVEDLEKFAYAIGNRKAISHASETGEKKRDHAPLATPWSRAKKLKTEEKKRKRSDIGDEDVEANRRSNSVRRKA